MYTFGWIAADTRSLQAPQTLSEGERNVINETNEEQNNPNAGVPMRATTICSHDAPGKECTLMSRGSNSRRYCTIAAAKEPTPT
jgi:hypothetical protein